MATNVESSNTTDVFTKHTHVDTDEFKGRVVDGEALEPQDTHDGSDDKVEGEAMDEVIKAVAVQSPQDDKRTTKIATTNPPVNDVSLVIRSFQRCKKADGTLSLDHYLCACNVLIRLCKPLGKGMKLVLNDGRRGVKALEIHRVRGAHDHYSTIDTLVHYEVNNGLSNTRLPVISGVRAIVKLHYTMAFIIQLLQELSGANTKRLTKNIYKDTLGKLQRWVVQKAVHIAIATLPDQSEMSLRIRNLLGEDWINVVGQLTQEGHKVYRMIQFVLVGAELIKETI